MATRAEEFQEVRNLLDNPKSGRPSADAIVSALLDSEQRQLNKLSNTGRAWSLATYSLPSAPGKDEYVIASADFGKLLYAYRTLSSGAILPIPSTEYGQEFSHQTYDIMFAPGSAADHITADKLAFFRNSDGTINVRIFPLPSSARQYTLVYTVGAADRDNMTWTDTTLIPEFSKYRTLEAALSLLPKTEWDGYNFEMNQIKKKELRESLMSEWILHKDDYEMYIKNPSHETIGTVGEWYNA